jgi:hypothetical protein
MIMNKITMLLCLALTAFTSRHAFGQKTALPAPFGPHPWTATVKVVGDGGSPLAGADVDVTYDVPITSDGNQPRYGDVKGITDDNGMFSASHTSDSTGLGILINKSGYYATHAGHQFYYDEKYWYPSFTVTLKKVGKPIAMYAKSITYIKFPVFNKPIGYDLMVGDWVAPYGKGVTADFLFTENHLDTKSGYTFTVRCPNNGDGLQEFNVPALLQNATTGQSDLRSSQEAPADGYQPHYEQTQGPDLNRNYYFRVRTVLDSHGNILSTHYGKIYGDFMQFTYYLNPTPNDRNVEFDPKHNLLGGLQSYEEVDSP